MVTLQEVRQRLMQQLATLGVLHFHGQSVEPPPSLFRGGNGAFMLKTNFLKRHLIKEIEDAFTFGPRVFSLIDCRHSVLVHWRGLERLRNKNQALDKNKVDLILVSRQ